MTEDLTQSHMLAAIGVLCVLAADDEREALNVSVRVGVATTALHEASAARKWLERKLRTLDVSGLPDDFPH